MARGERAGAAEAAGDRRREKRITKTVAYLRRSAPQALLGLPKMSETLIAFAKPLSDECLGVQYTAADFRAVLMLAGIIWNMTVNADDTGQEPGDSEFRELRAALVRRLGRALARPTAECELMVDNLERRKRELFAEDRRVVGDVQVFDDGGAELRIFVASRLDL